jgi:hypothetical protein
MESNKNDFDQQVAITLTALATALCRQPGINGPQLRDDMLEILERFAGSPEAVGQVGQQVVAVMDKAVREL